MLMTFVISIQLDPGRTGVERHNGGLLTAVHGMGGENLPSCPAEAPICMWQWSACMPPAADTSCQHKAIWPTLRHSARLVSQGLAPRSLQK